MTLYTKDDYRSEINLSVYHWMAAMRCILQGNWQGVLEYHASAECPVEVLFPRRNRKAMFDAMFPRHDR